MTLVCLCLCVCAARYHCVGDLNGDLTVDTSDLVDLLEDLSGTTGPAGLPGPHALVGGHHPSDLCRGDLDRNGRVDVEDLIYFITLFGATIPPTPGIMSMFTQTSELCS